MSGVKGWRRWGPTPRNGDPATKEQRASTGVGGEDRRQAPATQREWVA